MRSDANPVPASWDEIVAALQPLDQELELLSECLDRLRHATLSTIAGTNSALYTIDFVVLGATKRALSLESGLRAMIGIKNMLCARATIRMQIDTVSRLLAYTDVNDPLHVSREILGGEKLRKFKSRSGRPLNDGYLVDRLSEIYPWVRTVYDSTTNEVHFTEQQFMSSVHSMEDKEQGGVLHIQISEFDTKYPESSWAELPACFRYLCEIQIDNAIQWGAAKAT